MPTVPELPGQSQIWRLCPLSLPESAIYLKCPGFSRLLDLSWDNRVQTSSTTLELWLESLNHVSFMHSAVYLVATINCFAVLCMGGALQQNHALSLPETFLKPEGCNLLLLGFMARYNYHCDHVVQLWLLSSQPHSLIM